MSETSDLKSCPKCGAPIPAEAPQGLCPKCLLLQASQPTDPGKGGPPKSAPPRYEELAAAFPQLEIHELIGQGGMGFVFKARQPKLERIVALKILPQSLAAHPAFAERFGREGRLLARLNHPNIVTIHDFGQANGFFYLLMEYVDGVNLRQAMKAGRFTPAQALEIVPRICDALQFAHGEGVLHRDIKPENILLDTKGRVKIADFGIAKLLGENHPEDMLTGAGAVLGTPHYMAPEQLESPGAVDQRADIYSLGVVFYEMLTGELPIGKFQPPSQRVRVDVRLDEVVLHALEKEPSRRYQQASEVKTAVDTISASAAAQISEMPPTLSPRTSLDEKSASSGRTKRHLALGAGVGFCAFLLIILSTTVITSILPELYQAVARIKLEEITSATSATNFSRDPRFLPAEAETIKSEIILTKVIEHLNLHERWKKYYGNLTNVEVLGVLQTKVEVRPVEGSQVLGIRVWSENAREAAEIANEIVASYAAYNSERLEASAQSQKENQSHAEFQPATKLFRVVILEQATPPRRPSRPNRSLNIFMGGVVGILVGSAIGALVSLLVVWLTRKNIPSTGRPIPVAHPDRFWKRFALVGGLVILAMIVIPIVSILLALIIPAYQKAHEKAHAVRAEIASKGGDNAAVQNWQPTLEPGQKPDPQKILTETQALTSSGEYQEALKRILWQHKHALEFDKSMGAVRLSFGLSDWVELGRRYPPAKAALLQLRDGEIQKFHEGTGYGELFQEVSSINGYLGQDDSTVALFKYLDKKDNPLAQQCYFYAESLLVKQHEYELCAKYLGDPDQRFASIKQIFEMDKSREKRMVESQRASLLRVAEIQREAGITNSWQPPDYSEMQKKMTVDRFVSQVRQLVEVLVGTKRQLQAEKIKDEAVSILDDPRLKTAVEDASKRAAQT
jgi:serine/threonine protein kinase